MGGSLDPSVLFLQIILTVFNGLCFPLLSWFVFGAFQTSLKVAKDDDEQVKGMGHVYATLFVQCAPMVMVFSLVATWCLQDLPRPIFWIFSSLPFFVLVLFFANLLTFEVGRGQVIRSTRALLNKGRGHIFSGPGEGSVTSSVRRDGWEWWENLRSKRKSGELAVLDGNTMEIDTDKVDGLPTSLETPRSEIGISIVVEEPHDERRKENLRTSSPISLRGVDQHGDLLSPISNSSHRRHSQAVSSFSSQVTNYLPPIDSRADAARLRYAVAVYPWRTFCRWTKSWSGPMSDFSSSDGPSDNGTGSTQVDCSIGELVKESGWTTGGSSSDEETNFGKNPPDQDVHSAEGKEVSDSKSNGKDDQNPGYLRHISMNDVADVPEIGKYSQSLRLHPTRIFLNIVLLVILFPVLLITRLIIFCIIYLIVTLPLLIISTLFFPIASILCAFLHLYDVFSDTSETSGFHFFYTPSVILIWIASSFIAVLVVPCVLSGHFILGLIVWGLRRAVPVVGDERVEEMRARKSPIICATQSNDPRIADIDDCADHRQSKAGDDPNRIELAVSGPEASANYGPIHREQAIQSRVPLEPVVDAVPIQEEPRLCTGSRSRFPAMYEFSSKSASERTMVLTATDTTTLPARHVPLEGTVEIAIPGSDPNADTPTPRPMNESEGDYASHGFKFYITPNICCPTLPFPRIICESWRRIGEDVRRQKVFLYG